MKNEKLVQRSVSFTRNEWERGILLLMLKEGYTSRSEAVRKIIVREIEKIKEGKEEKEIGEI